MFDDSYVENLRRRYADRPVWERPDALFVATAPERAAQRAWMTRALDALPEPGRSALRRHLQTEGRFVNAYHELAAAEILRSAGCAVEYEPPLGHRTPDLLSTSPRGRTTILELWTRNRSSELKTAARRWRELQRRVAEIPTPLGLTVRGENGATPEPPTSGVAKRLVSAIRPWLLRTSTSVGSVLEAEGYRFEVVAQGPGLSARLGAPSGGGAFDTDGVLKAIDAKVRRYAELADSAEAALVIVIAAEPEAPLSLDLLTAALSGRQSFEVSFSPFQAGPIADHTWEMRSEPSSAEFASALSAVAWLQPDIDSPGALTVIPLPSAARDVDMPASPRLIVAR